MDYKLTDAWIDPPGMTEAFHTEKLVRLPETFFCCDPDAEDAPPVGELPARANGYVTFACSNTLMKLSPPVIEAWSKLLNRVPNSRLLLIAGGLASRGTADRIRVLFEREGIAAERLELVPLGNVAQGLEAVGRGDIGLDTFPYSGGTTTCNSLWMGVPAVTLAGPSPVGRQGVSLLSNLGLSQFVAQTVEQYIDIAAELARDLDRLAAIRASLRDRFRQSPITDGPRFARNVEAVLRSMWKTWCGEGS
jgi:predicted O-linked N-acetylglucosamine transferase (SPINDLY family)